MKRNTVIIMITTMIILLFFWSINGCALGVQKQSTTKRTESDMASQPRPEPVDSGSAVKTGGPIHQTDQAEPLPESSSRRKPERKPAVRKASAELTIYFEANSNELAPSETAKLDKIAETMRKHSQARVTLNGYTDAGGSADYNLMVAQGRASSVKFYLVGKGVDPSRISVDAKGAREFVADNETEDGRSLNRRVEIKIKMTK